ncbi:hypothetical protein X832_gp090 [Pseudomonas phage PAK_P5]|uniref:Uncharacterized protein n=1 Tax=Pseudomonas phage PAK_P5 TaxID=1327964 RepID=V5JWG3_9CAUD|nr:hypothetical protein X832_gp090 [Pseudomonas phage PAK_P5]AGR89560.1 hypothetical protein PAK_P500090 [Pseudomonas phage PAK_P5]
MPRRLRAIPTWVSGGDEEDTPRKPVLSVIDRACPIQRKLNALDRDCEELRRKQDTLEPATFDQLANSLEERRQALWKAFESKYGAEPEGDSHDTIKALADSSIQPAQHVDIGALLLLGLVALLFAAWLFK